ncbi:hypothetical protein [Actinorhabdospora filicis]|nr:hypothetical protein [Actinorhabdospora filicis]
MSAIRISRDHVDLLLTLAYIQREPLSYRGGELRHWDAEWFRFAGIDLIRTNLRSVQMVDTPEWDEADTYIPTFTYGIPKNGISPAFALKQVQYYEYQTCDWSEWDKSDAKAFCDALKSRLISRLPGWEEAPWGWHRDMGLS